MAKYQLEADSIETLCAQVVFLLKQGVEDGDYEPKNAKGDTLSCALADGSKVTVRLGKKKLDDIVKDGITVDGVRLMKCHFCSSPSKYNTEEGVPVCGGVKCMNAYREN